MSDAEQTLRLLRELERLDRANEAGNPNDSMMPGSDITAVAVFEALVASNFNLSAAILGVRRGS